MFLLMKETGDLCLVILWDVFINLKLYSFQEFAML